MEFQNLEIELAEKRIKEYSIDVKSKGELLDASNLLLKEREEDLVRKKKSWKRSPLKRLLKRNCSKPKQPRLLP